MKINPEYTLEVRRLIGDWLRQLREDKKLTQSDLSEKTGLSVWTISKIEHGKWNFTIDKLVLLLNSLDSYFFFLEKDSKDDLVEMMRKRWKRAHQEN